MLGCFFFGFVSIFACGLRFSQQTLPCIFFRWFALRFREETYAKKLSFPSGIFWRSFVEREISTILYPESSGFLVSGWAPGETLENSKKFKFLIDCHVTVCIILLQKSCGNKIPALQSLSWRPTAGQKA